VEPIKTCSLCGCDSNETAVFSCTYAKGQLEVCLECLTEGIMEIHKSKKIQPEIKRIDDDILENFKLESFNVPSEVFGFNCEKCGTVMFAETFPIACECGHVNDENVIKNLLRK
jgi:hypothetical protein